MIAAAIQKIQDIARPFTFKVNDRQYHANGIPVYDPEPKPVEVHTLTGLADYLKSGIGTNIAADDISFKIIDPANVEIIGPVFGVFQQRTVYARATMFEPSKFNFGAYMDVETFIVQLQAKFVPSATTEAILQLVGNIKDEKVKTYSDDGVSQTVVAKTGVAKVENVIVPNPVSLQPYRSFLEIEQPELKCVFRMQSGKDGGLPLCALHEADGGMWRYEAIASIKKWLMENIEGVPVIA